MREKVSQVSDDMHVSMVAFLGAIIIIRDERCACRSEIELNISRAWYCEWPAKGGALHLQAL